MILAATIGHQIVRALSFTVGMTWEILWALILGFALSGVVQAVVSKREMRRLMPDDSPKTLLVSTGLGAASSSCSYASVALARSLFKRGADFTSAMVFQFASTNLVFELGIVMALLLGWQFVLGRVRRRTSDDRAARRSVSDLPDARASSTRHAGKRRRVGWVRWRATPRWTCRPTRTATWWQRLRTPQGFTATADYFVMDWAAVWRDIAVGLLIAGALAAWVPHSFWQGLFLAHHPTLAKFWGPLIAPLVAIISFVCSVGNVPLAAVLWNGGISFGGVLTFIFADLIILPILHIYKKYYGWKMAGFLLVTFYATMVAAGLIVEFLFQGLGIERTARNAKVVEASISWNYTTYLNIAFLSLAAVLVWRYFRYGGGLKMLRMMNKPMDHQGHDHQARPIGTQM